MPDYGKPDATGRSSGKRSRKQAQFMGPPTNGAWTWITKEMLESDAWRGLNANARRLLDRLMLDHMDHAGTENGNLIATYEQLIKHGLTGDAIKTAVDQAEAFGFIKVNRGGRWAGTNKPSTYRLTWIGDKYHNAPTNDWKRITAKTVKEWKDTTRQQKKWRQYGKNRKLLGK